MKLTLKEVLKLKEIIEDYKMCSTYHYFVDVLDSDMCVIVEILAKNKATTWLRQYTAGLIEISTMCEIILENKK